MTGAITLKQFTTNNNESVHTRFFHHQHVKKYHSFYYLAGTTVGWGWLSFRSMSGSDRPVPGAAKLKALLTDSITLNLFSATVVLLYTSSARLLYEPPTPEGMIALKKRKVGKP